jgi:hypothetical protein
LQRWVKRRITARRIDARDGLWLGVCGHVGGQLPDATADGWRVCVLGDCVTISAPDCQPLLVSESEEMSAVAFSRDRTTFIIATSPGPSRGRTAMIWPCAEHGVRAADRPCRQRLPSAMGDPPLQVS